MKDSPQKPTTSDDKSSNYRSVGQLPKRLTALTALTILITQLIVILTTTLIYQLMASSAPTYIFMVTTISIIVIESIGFIVVFSLLSYPVDILTRAISSMLRERPRVRPPSLSSIHGVANSELTGAVRFIYQLDNGSPQPNQPDCNANEPTQLLQALPIGIAVLDNNLSVVAHNDNAPVVVDNNSYVLQLDFSTNGLSLQEWFDRVHNKAISADQTWTRIQNVPSGSLESRRVFDVIASYRQKSVLGANLIIITIDRTNEYADSEDNIDFVALAAHELRGPITVIRGYLDMLEEQLGDKASDEQRELLRRIDVSALRLASYINNVLNANRFDRHHLKLKMSEIKVSDIQNDVQDDLNLRAQTVGRHLVWQIDPNLPTIAADRSSISEVLTNLVDNAIKYSRANGQIEITATNQDNFVAISVTDHGVGIPASVADKLFTKFYRGHRSSASVGGTGIGLYISRAIVDSHGGSIGFNSTEGVGSVFTFTLPTYASVRDKLSTKDNSNEVLLKSDNTPIKNHSTVKE